MYGESGCIHHHQCPLLLLAVIHPRHAGYTHATLRLMGRHAGYTQATRRLHSGLWEDMQATRRLHSGLWEDTQATRQGGMSDTFWKAFKPQYI